MNRAAPSFPRRLALHRGIAVVVFAMSIVRPLSAVAGEAGKAPVKPATANAVEDEELSDEFTRDSTRVADPLERLNRAIFAGNEHVYRIAVRPLARGYERAVPRPVRKGLTNFFANIRFPVRLVGALLQGKGGRAMRETGRFAVNTVGGLGGFLRVSDRIGALGPEPTEDVGQAFGRWGIASGPFLVLPLLGPTTVRDLFGGAADDALTPIYWRFESYDDWEVRLSVQTVDGVVAASALLGDYDSLRAGALDPYLAVRSAYVAGRASAIRQ
jgi:phospholipid-binding lipoprotein MlaA